MTGDERSVPAGKRPPQFIVVEGTRCYRDYAAEHHDGKRGDIYPRWSNAIRYLPSRHKEFHDLMDANGIPGCSLNKRGQARVDGVEHQNKMMKVLGLANLDAGYRDLAPTNF